MKAETRYAYQKRIKELEDRNTELEDKIYEFQTACSEIYNGCIEVLNSDKLGLKISFVLERLKRVWIK